jgi:hypothetical protein
MGQASRLICGYFRYMDLPKPATILLRKDWLFSWIGAVVSVLGEQ